MKLTHRTELRRIPRRGSRDWYAIHRILDAGFLAHVGFCVKAQPFVIPMMYGRVEEALYLHGSAASRLLGALAIGLPACLTVTLVDGLVLARSAFDHSMNYRSVVAFGIARTIEDPAEKTSALRVISEHLIPGRWADVRGPSEKELKATTVLMLPIEEASVKVRSGPPQDDATDYGLPVWAGVLPVEIQAMPPIPDDRLMEGVTLPEYVRRFAARLRFGADRGNGCGTEV